MTQWALVGKTVKGAAHVRAQMPNQDAIRARRDRPDGLPIILAVADGHGSARAFRSDMGSNLAVETALFVAYPLLTGTHNPADVRDALADRFPRELVKVWLDFVEKDSVSKPFTEAEQQGVTERLGAAAWEAIRQRPVVAYGTTLLIAIVTNEYIACVQNGDGDILIVDAEGELHRPIAADARLIANETTSLSTAEAWRDFRTAFITLRGEPPALLMLSTDGYANSFVGREAFEKVATDIADMVRDDGIKTIEDNLEDWLKKATNAGSGDDITVGLICRTDLPPRVRPAAESTQTSEQVDLQGLS